MLNPRLPPPSAQQTALQIRQSNDDEPAPEKQDQAHPTDPAMRAAGLAPNPSDARPCHIS
jgi:hypothetical protein